MNMRLNIFFYQVWYLDESNDNDERIRFVWSFDQRASTLFSNETFDDNN